MSRFPYKLATAVAPRRISAYDYEIEAKEETEKALKELKEYYETHPHLRQNLKITRRKNSLQLIIFFLIAAVLVISSMYFISMGQNRDYCKLAFSDANYTDRVTLSYLRSNVLSRSSKVPFSVNTAIIEFFSPQTDSVIDALTTFRAEKERAIEEYAQQEAKKNEGDKYAYARAMKNIPERLVSKVRSKSPDYCPSTETKQLIKKRVADAFFHVVAAKEAFEIQCAEVEYSDEYTRETVYRLYRFGVELELQYWEVKTTCDGFMGLPNYTYVTLHNKKV